MPFCLFCFAYFSYRVDTLHRAKWSSTVPIAKTFSIPFPIMGVYYAWPYYLRILSGLLHQASLCDRTAERKHPPLENEISVNWENTKTSAWETVRCCQRAGRPRFGGARDTLLEETLSSGLPGRRPGSRDTPYRRLLVNVSGRARPSTDKQQETGQAYYSPLSRNALYIHCGAIKRRRIL